jgi:tetratricopeptide (TPR) repeat protein
MKSANENSSVNSLTKITKILILSVAALAAPALVAAQSINDDLHPAKPAVKPQASPRGSKKPAKSKATAKKPIPRTVSAAPAPTAPTAKSQPPAPAATPKTQPDQTPTPVAAVSAPAAMPSEIIERFMDFQKTTNVTERDWESVVKQTTAILQTSPDDKTAKAQLALAQGELAFSRADYSNALVQYNAAAQVAPEMELPFYGIGRVYLNTKQPNQAEDAFGRAVKINKNFALGYKGLGDALTAQGKTKKAQDYYKQAARVGVAGNGSAGNPNNASATATNNNTVALAATDSPYERELKIAREYTAQKKYQMALDKLNALAASSPSADLYIAIGDNYYAMQQWLSAQQAYRKATEINPNSALAFYKAGTVLYEMNEFQASGEAFEKSLILDQSGATINRAQARRMADKANEKARDMKKDGKKKGFLGIGL